MNQLITTQPLRERLERAAERLEAHAEAQGTSVQWNRLHGKAQGVRLALSYLAEEEAMHGGHNDQ